MTRTGWLRDVSVSSRPSGLASREFAVAECRNSDHPLVGVRQAVARIHLLRCFLFLLPKHLQKPLFLLVDMGQIARAVNEWIGLSCAAAH